MIQKTLNLITQADLQALIDNEVHEGKAIDFKRDLPGSNDEARREFLADVSSFANSSGGDLLFGIDEACGIATAIPGVAPENMDNEKQRLDNMLRTGLEPRLPSVELHPVPLEGGRWVLIVRAQQSWNAPHRVIFREHSKFYGRNSSGKYPLDVGELRIAFTQSEALADRIRNFRVERLAKIGAHETPVPIKTGAIMVAHFVPMGSFANRIQVDITARDRIAGLSPHGSSGFNFNINLDGHLNFSPITDSGDSRPGARAYTQCFRNGAVEFCSVFTPSEGSQSVHSTTVEHYLRSDLVNISRYYAEEGIEPPVYVFLSFLGVRGSRLGVAQDRFWEEKLPMDRDALIFPEIAISDFAPEPTTTLRPLFDMIWQAWGYDRSYNFDGQGNWTGR
ncbi:MAG: ATP-binding protein [Alphaproteobacteria bacterium]|nr:ATP-binding protein [Alphaproteobacteria bacterium]